LIDIDQSEGVELYVEMRRVGKRCSVLSSSVSYCRKSGS
jgi:hypothetical protein